MLNVELKFCLEYNYPEKSGYSVPRHAHPYYEIVYYVNGCGNAYIDGKKFLFYPNTVAIVKPEQIHYEKGVENTKVIILGFEYNEAFVELSYGTVKDDDKKILNLIQEIKSELFGHAPLYTQIMNNKLENILLLISRKSGVVEKNNEDNKQILEYIVNYIKLNSAKNIDCKELAKNANYSYDYFRHFFKKTMGVSIKQFINSERIIYIKKLLLNSTYSEKEIASLCNFSSATNFVKFFKKHTGQTPIRFRLENKDKLSSDFGINKLTYK